MTTKAADDFATIAARLRELESEKGSPIEFCKQCEDAGWVLSSYQGAGAPRFECCPACDNPQNLPSP
jgi:hypothetical protein